MRILIMLLAVAAMAVLPAAAAEQTKAAAPAKSSRAKTPAAPTSPVNLNTATQAQLEALPGVGVKAAQRILDYRKQNGSFKKVEEILERTRSGPDLLGVVRLSRSCPVSRHRQKSQQISQPIPNGGRTGGRTFHPIEWEGCSAC